MKQPSPDYTTQDLLAFYERVEPILAKWLSKPVWTARETAMLCAGYAPHVPPKDEKPTTDDEIELIREDMPLDPQKYVPSNRKMYYKFLGQLYENEPASPYDMMQAIRPMSSSPIQFDLDGRRERMVVEVRGSGRSTVKELEWYFMIGNAVGLQLPAIVPFGLLNKISNQMNNQHLSSNLKGPEKSQPKVITGLHQLEIEERLSVASKAADVKQHKLRERQSWQKTPSERGYHTTEEVAGITNLLVNTLNKYAREGRYVEGFTPFKRQNGKVWQWRDDKQQAAYEVSTTADKPKHSAK